MRYKCEECGAIFDKPIYLEFCYEDYCGVSSLFPNKHYGTYAACPVCESEEFDYYYEEENEDECQ